MQLTPTPEQLAELRAQQDVTYTIIINERQRYYLHKALAQFISEDPGEELDDMGQDIPTVLTDMLENSDEFPLSPTGVNSFVL